MPNKRAKRRQVQEANRIKNLINERESIRRLIAKTRARIKVLNQPYDYEGEPEQYVPLPPEGITGIAGITRSTPESNQ